MGRIFPYFTVAILLQRNSCAHIFSIGEGRSSCERIIMERERRARVSACDLHTTRQGAGCTRYDYERNICLYAMQQELSYCRPRIAFLSQSKSSHSTSLS